MDWLKRNKTGVGFGFAMAGFYVFTLGCPGLEQYCQQVTLVLTNLGSFLAGAGLIDSDFRSKFLQGKLPTITKTEVVTVDENNQTLDTDTTTTIVEKVEEKK